MNSKLTYYDKYQCVYTRPPGYFDSLANEITKFLQKKDNIRILDIGCGFGDLLDSFHKKLGDKSQYYGLTVTKHEFDSIQKNHPFIRVILHRQQDLSKIFKSGFDVIINFHTLSYIFQKEQLSVVNQMISTLDKEGLLVLGLIDDWIKINSKPKRIEKGAVQFYFSPWMFLSLSQKCSLVLSTYMYKDNYRIHFWRKIKNKRKDMRGLALSLNYILRNNLLRIDILAKIKRKIRRKINFIINK